MSDTEHVAASVLVPVLDERRHIDETARAMLAQDLDEPYEVLFIDGGSTDGTRERLAELAGRDPRVRVLDNPARYTPHALNIGLRDARAPVVVRMDAHTIYPRDYLRRGLERLRRGDVAWVSGPQLPRGSDRGSRRVALALSSRLGTGGASFRHAVGEEIEGDTGFTGVFDRAWLERVGGWDERWIINQDSELGARMREAGARIVILPEMAAHYRPRSALRALARQYARYGYYRCLTSRRHPASMRPGHVVPPALAAMLLAALGPRGPQRGLARLGVAAYAALLASSAARARREAAPRDAAAVPLVLATMHLSWGAGFLVASTRHGPPLRALAALAARVRPLRAEPRAATAAPSTAASARG